jgi:predicted dehydrogenase
MLNVGFIGFGNAVVNYHLPYLERKDNVEVKYIYRRDQDIVNDAAKIEWYPDIKFTTNFDDLLSDKELDLIVVATHVDSHADYAYQILKAGKHVLIEKPFANDADEAQEIFDFAKSKNLIVMANQNRRFDGDFLTLKKVLESGKLGNIIEIQSHYDYFRPESISKGFGLIRGLAVHTIDQLISLFGEPHYTHYDVRSIYYSGEGDDYVDIDFHYGQLKTTVKCSLSVMIEHPKFIVHGDRGSFVKYSSGHQAKNPDGPTKVSFEPEDESNWGRIVYVDDQGEKREELVPSEVTDYGLIYDNLEEAIKNGLEKFVKDDEVITVLNIMDEAEETAKNV